MGRDGQVHGFLQVNYFTIMYTKLILILIFTGNNLLLADWLDINVFGLSDGGGRRSES